MTFDEPPDGWVPTTLGAVAETVRYGYTASATTEPIGPRFLRITDIVGKALDWSLVPYCPASDDDRKKYELARGDIVIARTGASVGSSYFCAPPEPAVFASYLVRFRIDRSRADPRYVSYVLRGPGWRGYVRGASAGSAQPQLNARVMGGFHFALPPLVEQRRIAAVLGAIDDKIESNRRLLAVLERTAATLFRGRFVEFVGVEEFEHRESGRVPTGWTALPVGDVLKVVGGSTPSTKEPQYWDGSHCWATPKDLARMQSPILLDTMRHITDEGVARISSKLLPERTVLLSSRAPVGYTAISFVPVAVNQGFIAIPPSGVPSEFVLFWLREHMDEIKAHAGGTTFAEISKRQFRPLPMLVPPPEQLAAFEAVVRPMFDLMAAQEREALSLTAIRDALLPRLIAGETRLINSTDPSELIEPSVEALAAAAE